MKHTHSTSVLVTRIFTRMQGTAFQGKQLALAFEVWKKVLGDRCTIMMGMSGARVPAGMRRLVVRMIENRLIDCLVSTGANFFHDLHETLVLEHGDVIAQRHRPNFKMGRELEVSA
jgi:deoxyhypusine synthase